MSGLDPQELAPDIACTRCGGHGHCHPNRLAMSRAMRERPGPRSDGESTRERVEDFLTATCPRCDGSGQEPRVESTSGLDPQELDAIEARVDGTGTFLNPDALLLVRECRRLGAENAALRDELEEPVTRYLCMNGHHLVAKNEITVCDAPVHEDGIRPFVATGSIDCVRRCGAPVQRYRSDWEMQFEDNLEEVRAENTELRAALAAIISVYGTRVPTMTVGIYKPLADSIEAAREVLG